MPPFPLPDPPPDTVWRCVNAACTEVNIDKAGPLPADADVHCGECGQLCTLVG